MRLAEVCLYQKIFKNRHHDPDGQIDTVIIESVSTYSWFPSTGDDFIQVDPDTMEGSFNLVASEPILDEQEAWEGKFQFTGQPGEYYMVVWVPNTIGGSEFTCNFLASFPIPTTFE